MIRVVTCWHSGRIGVKQGSIAALVAENMHSDADAIVWQTNFLCILIPICLGDTHSTHCAMMVGTAGTTPVESFSRQS